jgi:uncharacterized protein YjiK
VIDEEELTVNTHKKATFHPSGISMHPQTRELYIIASNGKLLVVVDADGNTVAVKSLSSKIFNQPEGICFAPDGTLYISNEGKGSKGNILRFQYKKDDEH